jgi:hypothetical protein
MDRGRWNETTSFGRLERTRIETTIPTTQTIAVSQKADASFGDIVLALQAMQPSFVNLAMVDEV